MKTLLYSHIEERMPHGDAQIALLSPVTALPPMEWDDPRWLPCRAGEFFRGLPDQTMVELVPLAPLFRCPGNTVLFAEEQPPRSVLFLLEGKVKLSMNSVEGRRLWHDPRKRECALGSVTSLMYAGDKVIGVHYAEPSGPTRGQVAGA